MLQVLHSEYHPVSHHLPFTVSPPSHLVSPFVFKEPPLQLCQDQSFVHCSIILAGAPQATHQNLTGATEQAAENPTPECHVQRFPNESHNLTSLSVPLPNKIETPVTVYKLSVELNDYPFPDLKDYLLCGFCQGFRQGYTGLCFSIAPKNLKSASDNEVHVTDAIAKELICRHISGPFKTPPIHLLHCSPLGAVPKRDMSLHLILDLSSPKGLSVNDWISKDDFSVTFSKFDDAVNLVRVAERGELIAKNGH